MPVCGFPLHHWQLTYSLLILMDASHIVSVYLLINYSALAGKVLFLYDFMVMFEEEFSFVRASKWSAIKIVYVLARYLPFIDVATAIYIDSAPNLTEDQCKIVYSFDGWMYIIGIGLSEVVLTYRLWLIWEKDRRLKYILPIFACAVLVTGAVLLTEYNGTRSFVRLPSSMNRGCVYLALTHLIWTDWALLLLYNTVTLALLVLKFTYYGTGFNSSLLRRLVRDGVWYYLFIFVVSVTHVSVTLSVPPEYADMFPTILRSLHSNVSSRVILDIHSSRMRREDDSVELVPTSRGTESQ